jgi:hypothetical protein
MDFQKADDYVRAHAAAVLIMAAVVIPSTVAVVSYFGPESAGKLRDVEARMQDLDRRVVALDRWYQEVRDDANRWVRQDGSKLYSESDEKAAIPSASGAKGTP